MRSSFKKKHRLYFFFSDYTQFRGGEKFVFEICSRMVKSHQVTLVVEQISPYWKQQFTTLHISVRVLWKPKYLYWPLLPIMILVNFLTLKKIITVRDTVFAANFPLTFLSVLLSKKTIVFCFEPYSMFYDNFRISQLPLKDQVILKIIKFIWKPFDHLAVTRAQLVATLNKQVGEAIKKTYHRAPNFFIPNGVDSLLFSPQKRPIFKKPGYFIIGHSTDYSPLKGTETLLKAIPKITKKNKHICVLISESMCNLEIRKKYQALIEHLKIDQYIIFIGRVEEKNLPGFYTSCDIFCYCGSTHCVGGSSASLSVIEAQSCGVPVLRTKGNSDEIVQKKTGLYFESENPHEIAMKINLFYDLPNMIISSMRREARKHVIKNFSWAASAASLYHQL